MKKKYWLVILAVLFSACTAKKLNVEVPKEVNAEYGKELEYQRLFDAKNSDQNVQVKKIEGFNKLKLGKQEIKVVFTNSKTEITKGISVNVEDTKKPVIKFDKKEIKVNIGEQFDVNKNIKKVFDYVDGELKYRDHQIKKDGYTIDKSKLNLDKVGTYKIKVIAYDQNKNKSVATFKVIVEDKNSTKKNQQESLVVESNESFEESLSSQKPATSINPSNSDSVNPNPNHKSNTCHIGILPKGAWIGNSGMIFKTMQEAGEWGANENVNGDKWDVTNGWEGFSVIECLDECGNSVYTVDFYK